MSSSLDTPREKDIFEFPDLSGGRSAEARSRKVSKKKKQTPSININKKNPALFLNRELSWLEFNYRVLQEAGRKEIPLLERLKFISIFESNLIEFFMIRVAGLKQIRASSYDELQLDGRTPAKTLEEISPKVNLHLEEMDRLLNDIYEQLEALGIRFLKTFQDLKAHEKKFCNDYFQSQLFRVLTPLAVDPGHPFPRIGNTRLNLAVVLERNIGKAKKEEAYVFVEVPTVLPRFIKLPGKNRKKEKDPECYTMIALEEIIKMHLKELFVGTKIKSVHEFTVIRNNDLAIDEVASDNLLATIEDELKNRRWGEIVCLHCREKLPENIKQFLLQELDLEEHEIYERTGVLNMQNFEQLYKDLHSSYSSLYNPPFIPRNVLPMNENYQGIFAAIRQKERLFHHPYDSFQSVVDLIRTAARDPKVLAIKQTLYRIGKDSPFVRALIEAAENGKQVTALVELKARFDEERNISWAREMENHGIHVVYGVLGLKIHGKILQIVRREKEGTRSYTHFSTGNYNVSTAKTYTDIGLMTADPELNHDVANLFHSLTGVAALIRFKKIATAPINMRSTLMRLIQREIRNAQKSKPARIRLKINSLEDPEMIIALYRASLAGVRIELNVRGICCLRPGVPRLSENIRVVSLVGQFLEHSRIFYFENEAKPSIFLSSADWMSRNLSRRVETLFPLETKEHIESLGNILDSIFKDNYNLSELKADGSYEKVRPKGKETRFSAHRFFCSSINQATQEKKKEKKGRKGGNFVPLTSKKNKDR